MQPIPSPRPQRALPLVPGSRVAARLAAQSRARRVRRGAAAAALAIGAAGFAGPLADGASAAPCPAGLRYSSERTGSNTLYLEAGSWTLPAIRTACPSVPLAGDAAGVWLLRANLVVRPGAALRIAGPAAGGPVAQLRLRSDQSGTRTGVVEITNYGTLAIESTVLTSWDTAAGGPDQDVSNPLGSKGKGRAFVRTVSYRDAGVDQEARTDVADSDLRYLGYAGGEAYGVSWKARCAGSTGVSCDDLDVFGSQRNSRFQRNYMGTYVWGGQDMVFDGNEYDHNISYGLDPHDDTDHTTITRNHAHHNGDHGIICSQRCDHLLIAENVVHHNGIPGVSADGADEDDGKSVHGIMLHRRITEAVVRDNQVFDHPTGAGIAVFDSSDLEIRDNRVANALWALRFSVSSRRIAVTGNELRDRGADPEIAPVAATSAVYSYIGSDKPSDPATLGRNADVTFTRNTFAGGFANLVRIGGSDRFRFVDNRIVPGDDGRLPGPGRFTDARDGVWQGPLPRGGLVLRSGSTVQVVPPATP